MGFTFSIKKIEPLKNEETKNKAIVKFWRSEFENYILTKIVCITSNMNYNACE